MSDYWMDLIRILGIGALAGTLAFFTKPGKYSEDDIGAIIRKYVRRCGIILAVFCALAALHVLLIIGGYMSQ